MFGWSLSAVLLAVSIGVSAVANANGGQVQQNRPLVDPNTGDVVGIVVPTEACENYDVVTDQSGKVLYVICTDESD